MPPPPYAFGDDPEADRRALPKIVGSVSLAKCDPKRRGWQPVSERIELRWADGSEPKLPELPKTVRVPVAA